MEYKFKIVENKEELDILKKEGYCNINIFMEEVPEETLVLTKINFNKKEKDIELIKERLNIDDIEIDDYENIIVLDSGEIF